MSSTNTSTQGRENAPNSNTTAATRGVPVKRGASSTLTQPTAASRSRQMANQSAVRRPRPTGTTAPSRQSSAGPRGSVLGAQVVDSGTSAKIQEMEGMIAALTTQFSAITGKMEEQKNAEIQKRIEEQAVAVSELKEAKKAELLQTEMKFSGEVDALQSRLRETEEVAESRRLRQLQSEALLKQKDETIAFNVRQLEEKSQQLRDAMNQLTEAEIRHRTDVEGANNRALQLQTQLNSAEVSLAAERSQNTQNQITLAQKEADIVRLTTELKMTIDKFTEELRMTTEKLTGEIEANKKQYKIDMDSMEGKLDRMTELTEQRQKKIEELEETLEMREEHISYLEEKARIDEAMRRKLHNTIQELKGNIRVICRIRPLLGNERADSVRFDLPKKNPQEMTIVNEEEVKDLSQRRTAATGGQSYQFKFDRVFGPDSRQSDVFEEISHLVQSALDGYNCCIFAYGQTGSGKTFTMEGPGVENAADDANAGMIQRAVTQIFKSSEALAEQGWKFDFTASFVEIYNEQLRDLIGSKKTKEDIKHDIRHDPKTNKTWVTNLTTVPVKTPGRVHELLQRAARNRATGSTNMNEQSSRSHSVFQMIIKGCNEINKEEIEGILNLIDLAGSERVDQSRVTGAALQETININKSLSNLGNCIQALANNDKHVPYRSSKLTYLLQNSLGGNSKTLMFVNISPAGANMRESLNSLQFAQKVNACDIGTARKSSKVELQ